jgi:hypothetical protein
LKSSAWRRSSAPRNNARLKRPKPRKRGGSPP